MIGPGADRRRGRGTRDTAHLRSEPVVGSCGAGTGADPAVIGRRPIRPVRRARGRATARYAVRVSLLRRSPSPTSSSTGKAAEAAAAQPTAESVRVAGGTAAKGRPTPKRREAENRRRGPAPAPPKTQREAAKLAKANRPPKEEQREQRRRETERRRIGMARGEDKYLPSRDRGPVRAYVRDVVDSRPHLLGLFMPLALVVVVSVLVPVPAVQQYMSLFSLVMLMVMIAEGVYLGLSTTARVRAKFPDENVSALGTGWYAFTRATQPRRLRMPKPRVERGANP